MLTFKIESEMDLHVKVVSFLKKRYPHSLFTVRLGENQDTVHKRIDSFKKGYLCSSPDLIINNLHKRYSGFAIEMKSPKRKWCSVTLSVYDVATVSKQWLQDSCEQ